MVHRPRHPAFFEDAPYNVAIVELEEGPRLYPRIVGWENQEIAIGMSVGVALDNKNDDVTMLDRPPRR